MAEAGVNTTLKRHIDKWPSFGSCHGLLGAGV